MMIRTRLTHIVLKLATLVRVDHVSSWRPPREIAPSALWLLTRRISKRTLMRRPAFPVSVARICTRNLARRWRRVEGRIARLQPRLHRQLYLARKTHYNHHNGDVAGRISSPSDPMSDVAWVSRTGVPQSSTPFDDPILAFHAGLAAQTARNQNRIHLPLERF